MLSGELLRRRLERPREGAIHREGILLIRASRLGAIVFYSLADGFAPWRSLALGLEQRDELFFAVGLLGEFYDLVFHSDLSTKCRSQKAVNLVARGCHASRYP